VRSGHFGARAEAASRIAESARSLNALLGIQAARISNLLHDDVSQTLASAHIVIDDVAQDLPVPAQMRLLKVRQHLHDVAEQLRRMSHTLHPGIVDDLGLSDAVEFTARVFRRTTGIQLAVTMDFEDPCPPPVAGLLFRVVQEALDNISRHAGATSASISVERDRGRIICTVSDNGAGFNVAAALGAGAARGLGLGLTRARVEAAGGIFEIESASAHGTRLRASIPVEI